VAITATLALAYSHGSSAVESLTHGYRVGFGASVAFATLGLAAALALIPDTR
jgi:hypothetical protein